MTTIELAKLEHRVTAIDNNEPFLKNRIGTSQERTSFRSYNYSPLICFWDNRIHISILRVYYGIFVLKHKS